ncbi:hypothetical protein ACRASX_16335 (plasmid) [Flavobacterium sp. TMP13]|uniref:hypothetical protein n=1 Tax=Flavobacterium sp. TMP13 TaxID=3425950 RepID=UPI003D77C139
MKFFINLYLLLTFNLIAFSQTNTVLVEKNQYKINILIPGIVYEHGFSSRNTLYSDLSFGFGYRKSDFYGESKWSFFPKINEQFRHYYNLEKRSVKGKNINNNSGNFIALNAIYNFKSLSTTNEYDENTSSFTIAPIWGIQRTYKRKFNLELQLGAGLNIDQFETQFTPVINFTLGWVIGK